MTIPIMKKDIILAGVGGQGILSIAAIIGYAALEDGLFLKQSEVHGMSQRGGDVSSNLRISGREIYSDLIPKGNADLVIGVEPMEALRYLPMLSPQGWLISSTNPFINIPNYPDINTILAAVKAHRNHVAIDAEGIAKQLKSAKSANMVILGAASPYLDITFEKLQNAIRAIFKRKGEAVVEDNLVALQAGRDFREQ
jgi:indolepyruvate ferredoxin oxidoreductase, beta subunit